MGPRSHERGNIRVERCRDAGAKASMGPRSHERGNISPPLPTPDTSTLLQWGRVLTNAETNTRGNVPCARDIASMGPRSHERGNDDRERVIRRCHVASMGPRSHERGNIRREAASRLKP